MMVRAAAADDATETVVIEVDAAAAEVAVCIAVKSAVSAERKLTSLITRT